MRVLIRAFLITFNVVPAAYAQTVVAPHQRFDMIQNGQKMTASDFNQWMAQRGLRIVTRKNAANASLQAISPTPPQVVIPVRNITPVVDEQIRAAGPGSIVGF